MKIISYYHIDGHTKLREAVGKAAAHVERQLATAVASEDRIKVAIDQFWAMPWYKRWVIGDAPGFGMVKVEADRLRRELKELKAVWRMLDLCLNVELNEKTSELILKNTWA